MELQLLSSWSIDSKPKVHREVHTIMHVLGNPRSHFSFHPWLRFRFVSFLASASRDMTRSNNAYSLYTHLSLSANKTRYPRFSKDGKKCHVPRIKGYHLHPHTLFPHPQSSSQTRKRRSRIQSTPMV
ncbi:hypothetical protein BJV78DRAFT_1233381 [Lactifluus subvellereus]|nr:hypothetical protein BJV78DRAFT_1233381 [Lactifluus subvellereus]